MSTDTNECPNADVWENLHRVRLVSLSNKLRAAGRRDIDAGIGKWSNDCSKKWCKKLSRKYGTAEYRTDPTKFRYNIVVDGWGAPDRLAKTMCSGSVVFRATLFREWFYRYIRKHSAL